MACTPIIQDGIKIGWMCGDFSADEIRMETCGDCNDSFVADYLCDYPVAAEQTCDRPLCKKCAKTIGHDMHYCTSHHETWRDYEKSGEGHQKILDAISSGKQLTVIK